MLGQGSHRILPLPQTLAIPNATLKLYTEWNKGLDKRTAEERFTELYKKVEAGNK